MNSLQYCEFYVILKYRFNRNITLPIIGTNKTFYPRMVTIENDRRQ
jgi:hypothetical protein